MSKVNQPGEDDVSGIEIEKTRINLFNAVGFLVMLSGGVAMYVTTAETTKANAQALLLQNLEIAKIKEKLAPLDTYGYRTGQVETQIVEANKRIDRVVDSFNNKMDAVISGLSGVKDDVAGVKSDVRVLTQRVAPGVSPTQFQIPLELRGPRR